MVFMTFIAKYWLVWLIGVLICGSFALYKFISNFMSAGSMFLKASQVALQSVELIKDEDRSLDEKVSQVQDAALEHLITKGKSKIVDVALSFVAVLCSYVFGILLIVSTILNIIDYYKS